LIHRREFAAVIKHLSASEGLTEHIINKESAALFSACELFIIRKLRLAPGLSSAVAPRLNHSHQQITST